MHNVPERSPLTPSLCLFIALSVFPFMIGVCSTIPKSQCSRTVIEIPSIFCEVYPCELKLSINQAMACARAKCQCAVFEALAAAEDLRLNELPTYLSIVKCFNHVQADRKANTTIKNPSKKDVANIDCETVESIWYRASIPTVSSQRIEFLILKEHTKVQELNKSYTRFKTELSETFREQLDKNIEKAGRLFDVASCKCMEYANSFTVIVLSKSPS